MIVLLSKGKKRPIGYITPGGYKKTAKGWVKVRNKKKTAVQREALENKKNNRGHISIEDYNPEKALNIVNRDLLSAGIDNKAIAEQMVTAFQWYTDIETDMHITLRAASYHPSKSFFEDDIKKAVLIEQYLKVAPRYKGNVYRQIVVDSSIARKFEESSIGNVIDMKGFSSWTSDRKVAEEFAGAAGKDDHPILFSISDSSKGCSIVHLSGTPLEEEVMFSKNQVFRIMSVKTTPAGTEVALKEVG